MARDRHTAGAFLMASFSHLKPDSSAGVQSPVTVQLMAIKSIKDHVSSNSTPFAPGNEATQTIVD